MIETYVLFRKNPIVLVKTKWTLESFSTKRIENKRTNPRTVLLLFSQNHKSIVYNLILNEAK